MSAKTDTEFSLLAIIVSPLFSLLILVRRKVHSQAGRAAPVRDR